jgi:hypothetical protein
MYLALVQAPHGMRKPQGTRLRTGQKPHQPTEQRHQPSCGPSCLGNHPQPRVAGSDGHYGLQFGQQLTGQTRMENMGILLVSFNGGGKHKQGTSSPDLSYGHVFPHHYILASHQIGRSLP